MSAMSVVSNVRGEWPSAVSDIQRSVGDCEQNTKPTVPTPQGCAVKHTMDSDIAERGRVPHHTWDWMGWGKIPGGRGE